MTQTTTWGCGGVRRGGRGWHIRRRKEEKVRTEPANQTLQNLKDALEQFTGCAVVISHDRWFLDRLCTHILAFEGDSHVEWFEGNFEAYEEDKK